MANAASLNKVTISKAFAICKDIQLEPMALQYLESDPAPVEFLNTLLEQQYYPDAVRFLSRALPNVKRPGGAVSVHVARLDKRQSRNTQSVGSG